MSILSKVFSAGAGKLVLITVIGAYFGGRSLEKVKK
jgi:hypothetical protein